jgi:hypothetical protein
VLIDLIASLVLEAKKKASTDKEAKKKARLNHDHVA